MTVVRKVQFEYETAVLPGASTSGRRKGTGLSIASLILGLSSLTPATFIAGIPAVICGALALKRRLPGRRMAIAGIATGSFGTLVLTFVMLLPLIAWQVELYRAALVKLRMQTFRAAVEDYAAEHAGRYPYEGISWEKEDDEGMVMHFKAPGPLITAGSRKSEEDELKLRYREADRPLAGIPVNPYTNERYRNGKDLFYRSDYLAEAGSNAAVNAGDPRCPFVGLAAPGGVPGTILILGWTPSEAPGAPIEYAIVGYGRNTAEPLTSRLGRAFHVLHN
jgi:hypothetical protein